MVTELWPDPGREHALAGLYLSHPVARTVDGARVYSNFVTSLDGRIALRDPVSGRFGVPRTIANARDWRLYQELAAQADAIVVSGRYVRELAEGSAQAGLPVSEAGFDDLRAFRVEHGLAPQPAVVVVSGSLDLPLSDALCADARERFVATGAAADPARSDALRQAGFTVLTCGGGQRVVARELIAQLAERGLRNLYVVAGPVVLNTFLGEGCLDRLYLTTVNRVLGGDEFATFADGAALVPPVDFRLAASFLDRGADGAPEQTFSVLDRV